LKKKVTKLKKMAAAENKENKIDNTSYGIHCES
jgi:hypothetical protein